MDLFLTSSIYSITLIFVSSTAYLGSLQFKNQNLNFGLSRSNKLTVFHLLGLLTICFIVGFRFEIGNDWIGYKEYFEQLSLFKITYDQQSFEIGYYLINKLFAFLGFNYTSVFFLSAFLTWYFIYKSVPAFLLPIVLFYFFVDEIFFSSMNLVRQFIAIGLFLYGLRFIVNKKFYKYFSVILFGSLFHVSVLITLPLYFLPYKKMYNQTVWVLLFIISIILAGNSFLIEGVMSILMTITSEFEILAIYYSYFESGKILTGSLEVGIGFYLKTIINIIILIFSKDVIQKYPKSKIYFILFFIGLIAFNSLYMFQMINRVNIYLMVIRPIVLAFITYHLWCKNNKGKILSAVLVMIYIVIFFAAIQVNSNMCCPYQMAF